MKSFGHLKAFKKIYQHNYPILYRTARKVLGNGYEVNDILQEVFIEFFEKNKNGASVHHPRSWLYRVTLNKCMDVLRHERKFADTEPSQEIPDPGASPGLHEEKAMISACLAALKPHEKALCVLYSEGLTYREMAEITGIAFSSIGKTLSRSLAKMEKLMKERGYEMHG